MESNSTVRVFGGCGSAMFPVIVGDGGPSLAERLGDLILSLIQKIGELLSSRKVEGAEQGVGAARVAVPSLPSQSGVYDFYDQTLLKEAKKTYPLQEGSGEISLTGRREMGETVYTVFDRDKDKLQEVSLEGENVQLLTQVEDRFKSSYGCIVGVDRKKIEGSDLPSIVQEMAKWSGKRVEEAFGSGQHNLSNSVVVLQVLIRNNTLSNPLSPQEEMELQQSMISNGEAVHWLPIPNELQDLKGTFTFLPDQGDGVFRFEVKDDFYYGTNPVEMGTDPRGPADRAYRVKQHVEIRPPQKEGDVSTITVTRTGEKIK
ncbi:MAG: hypothetical protein KDK76_02320 [Chlamydiia bacterium]|nr:hypothetical protein [Chlamydiia bacterium]